MGAPAFFVERPRRGGGKGRAALHTHRGRRAAPCRNRRRRRRFFAAPPEMAEMPAAPAPTGAEPIEAPEAVLKRVFGYGSVPRRAARGHRRHPLRPRRAGRDAHRRGQVHLLSGAGAGYAGLRAGDLAAHLADEGSGGGAQAGGRGGGVSQQFAHRAADGHRPSEPRRRAVQAGLRRPPSACSRRAFSACAARCRSPWSPWTRRTASPNGGRIFRPSYLDLPKFIDSLPARPRLCAFTATATRRVRCDIQRLLGLRDPFSLVTGFDRPNLRFFVERPRDKMAALSRVLDAHEGESGIVYCGHAQGGRKGVR